jgi:hypothetical protein
MFGFLFRLVGRVIGFVVKGMLFVAALAVVAAGTMYALFDAEQYKRVLTQRVVDVTGRALSVHGPVELQLGLPPRVILHDVRLKNARWASRPDMARVKRVEIKIDPLKAIAGESGTTDLRLEGVDLALETGVGGVGNWEFGPLATTAGAAGAAGAFAVSQLLAPVLPGASIVVSDATILFRDGATGRSQTFSLGAATTVEVASGNLGPTGAGIAVASVTDKREDPCEKDEPLKLVR